MALLDCLGAVARIGGWELDLLTQELCWTAETYRIHGVDADFQPTLEAALGFFTADPRPAIRAALASASPTGWDLELPLNTADGRSLWVRLVGRLILADGRPVRALGAIQDVTERNQLQAALQHSQKLNAIGSLAAGIAHDFNNILQTVGGGLEIALDDLDPDSQGHDMAAMGLRAAQRGSQLTSHLLSFARKQVPQPGRVNLATLLAEIEPLLSRTLGPQIIITQQVGAEVPEVFADACQLETALLNLAINAAHAMPDGGRLILAARLLVDGGARWVSLSVTDTGSGMDAATLAQATERFFSTKGQNGTGLGLSMVRGFAEESGGKLRLTSAPGQGTRAELVLPAVEPPVQLRPVTARVATRRCVLLVDDEPGVLQTTGAVLERAGLTVLRASGGDAALARLADGASVDAVVSDYAMPGLNGADLIARAQLVRPGLPAVLVSGVEDLGKLRSLPRDLERLNKPFARQDLLAALNRLWDARASAA